MYVLEPMPYIFSTFPSDFLKNIRMTYNIRHRRLNGWRLHDIQNTSSSVLRVKLKKQLPKCHLNTECIVHYDAVRDDKCTPLTSKSLSAIQSAAKIRQSFGAHRL